VSAREWQLERSEASERLAARSGARVATRAPAVPAVPSVLRCGFLIFALKLGIRTVGFPRVRRWVRRRVEAVSVIAAVDVEAVKATEYAVAMAGAWYPGRALCLEQSLVLYYVLRRQGVGVKFMRGVQAHPFAAHAWVEYHGEIINDVLEHVRHFTPLPDELP